MVILISEDTLVMHILGNHWLVACPWRNMQMTLKSPAKELRDKWKIMNMFFAVACTRIWTG